MRKTYDGSCHCGKVAFRVTGDLGETVKCNCSICRMKGFLHLIVPPADFQLLRGESELTTYRFNTGVAKHMFCSTCGVHPFYTPRSDPDKVDVNVNCLDGVDVSALSPRLFDGENWEDAIKTYRR
jgi:hypothetical protein